MHLTQLLDQSPQVNQSIEEGVNPLVLNKLIEYLSARPALLVNSLIAYGGKRGREPAAAGVHCGELVSPCDIHHLLSAKQVIYILSLPGAPLFIK